MPTLTDNGISAVHPRMRGGYAVWLDRLSVATFDRLEAFEADTPLFAVSSTESDSSNHDAPLSWITGRRGLVGKLTYHGLTARMLICRAEHHTQLSARRRFPARTMVGVVGSSGVSWWWRAHRWQQPRNLSEFPMLSFLLSIASAERTPRPLVVGADMFAALAGMGVPHNTSNRRAQIGGMLLLGPLFVGSAPSVALDEVVTLPAVDRSHFFNPALEPDELEFYQALRRAAVPLIQATDTARLLAAEPR